jgi:flagellar biosynthesis component FlhA
MPRIGLAADQLMVLQASPEGLGDWGSDWIPATNPATWQPAGIVARASPDEIERAGPVVWKPHEYLLGDLAGIIRQQAPSFVTAAVVDDMVKGLDAFPVLKQAVLDKVPSSLLVAVLRELLREGIPIRNLVRITELLLRYQYGAMGAAMDPVAYVRMGMADLIASQVSRGTETVVAYLLGHSKLAWPAS